jgi:hypothetical protein
MSRELEREHSTKRCTSEIERLAQRQLVSESRGVLSQRLAWIRRRNGSDRPDVPNRALRLEETFVCADT